MKFNRILYIGSEFRVSSIRIQEPIARFTLWRVGIVLADLRYGSNLSGGIYLFYIDHDRKFYSDNIYAPVYMGNLYVFNTLYTP